jgi:hypothetical protein
MIKPRQIFLQRTIFIALILIGAILFLWFGLRSVRSFVRVQRTGIVPGTTDVELLRGWMTIPYISQAYHVPETVLYQSLGISGEGQQKKSLADLNRQLAAGKQRYVLEVVTDTILHYQPVQSTEGTVP